MGSIQIQGGRPLCGEVSIQGSKNAALPVMAASVLAPGITTLKNCPEISDVACMCELLRHVGAKVYRQENVLTIDATEITDCRLPREYVTRMRSSVVLAGAMLGRCHEISLTFPGGCVIGDRPIDMHIQALKELGAEFTENGDNLSAKAARLKGAVIILPFPSVGATENAVMAAVLAEGTTEIYRCAKEPEITALCDFLNCAGAKITGQGSGHITIEGVERLHGCTYEVEPDRIVAGTYLIGALAAGGRVFLRNAPAGQLGSVCELAGFMGAKIAAEPAGIRVERQGKLRSPGFVETGIYPAFPTDLQSPFLVALCQAETMSCLTERIFNGRLAVVEELNRMGANIRVENNCAAMDGGQKLKGCSVTAKELRGGAALVLAGICAQGMTLVYNRHFIDRGYEDIVRDLKSLGVNIGGKK
ncbi:MAG: UDP-N-acetylglucosamine 1-carboxyvinyltransferase [Eubacteriales bacterium]|nr:UDP-N-acetylglucosamine 1-carboxyvinyltransferase [Eubacteriales bacterium]